MRTERPVELVVVGSARPRRPGRRGDRPVRPRRRRPLHRPGHRRRAGARPAQRRGGRGAVAVRGLLAARWSRRWRAPPRSSPPPAARCPRWPAPDGETALLVPPGDAAGAGRGDRPRPRRPGAARTGSARPAGSGWSARSPGVRPPLRTAEVYRRAIGARDRGEPRADRRLRPSFGSRPATGCSTSGCGAGRHAFECYRRGGPGGRARPQRRATSTEVARMFAAMARGRRAGPGGRAVAVRGDAHRLPFPDGAFDARHPLRGPGAHPRRPRRHRRGGPGPAAGRDARRHRAPLVAGADLLGAVRRVPRGRGRPRAHLPAPRAARPGCGPRRSCRWAAITRTRCTRRTGGCKLPVRHRQRTRPAAAALPPLPRLRHHAPTLVDPDRRNGCSTRLLGKSLVVYLGASRSGRHG